MTKNTGASVPDQALVSDGAASVSTLTGFDPSRCADLQIALDLALNTLAHYEPCDSRAVSNEFVAMAAIASGQDNLDECRQIIRDALGDDAATSLVNAEKVATVSAEQDALEQYVAEYETCCDEGYYAPTEHERGIIMDAMQGWLVDRDRLIVEARAASAIEAATADKTAKTGLAEGESAVAKPDAQGQPA